MADRIVVMKDGHILQQGAPMEIYDNPIDVFTARFIGTPSMNILPVAEMGGMITQAGDGARLLAGIRPQALLVGAEGPAALTLAGTVSAIETLGPETLVHFDAGGRAMIATAPARSAPEIGGTITATAAPGTVHLFDPVTEAATGRC